MTNFLSSDLRSPRSFRKDRDLTVTLSRIVGASDKAVDGVDPPHKITFVGLTGSINREHRDRQTATLRPAARDFAIDPTFGSEKLVEPVEGSVARTSVVRVFDPESDLVFLPRDEEERRGELELLRSVRDNEGTMLVRSLCVQETPL